MQNRPAFIVLALVVSLVAGSALTAVSGSAARAAECLTAPKTGSSQDGHWRYRIDRSTKQKCWYLADEKQKPAQVVSSSASPEPVAPKPKAPIARQVADARAEWQIQRPSTEPPSAVPLAVTPAQPAATDSGPTADALIAAAPRWALASRFADRPDAGVATDPQPMTTARAETDPPADATSEVVEAEPAVEAAPVTAPQLPVGRLAGPANSVQMLMIMLAGSLALAGIIGASVLRLSRARQSRRRNARGHRRVNWDLPLNAEALPLQPFDEPAPETLPRWLQIARTRMEADRASQEIEDLLSRTSRPTAS